MIERPNPLKFPRGSFLEQDPTGVIRTPLRATLSAAGTATSSGCCCYSVGCTEAHPFIRAKATPSVGQWENPDKARPDALSLAWRRSARWVAGADHPFSQPFLTVADLNGPQRPQERRAGGIKHPSATPIAESHKRPFCGGSEGVRDKARSRLAASAAVKRLGSDGQCPASWPKTPSDAALTQRAWRAPSVSRVLEGRGRLGRRSPQPFFCFSSSSLSS